MGREVSAPAAPPPGIGTCKRPISPRRLRGAETRRAIPLSANVGCGTGFRMNGVERRGAPPVRAAAHLKVFLLGRFEVVRGDAPIPQPAWRRRRPADLLKLVALAPGHVLGRDAAIEMLWPDKDPANGANNLHRALYDLRQILGGRWVDLEHGEISLGPGVWLDVDAFEAAATSQAAGAQESAISLYRGDLSPRERLRALLAGAALPLARAAAERGEGLAAIALLRRVLDADPARQEAHRMLVRLLAETGRRADALRQYDACESALRARGLG